jgi:PAS domain S-box-containing protein
MKVLVVDDQYINRYLLEKLLAGYGFEVVLAGDGIEALEKMQNGDINLIISDILLPRMDGFQFCKEIRSNPAYRHVPFVFYSAAYTEQKDRVFAESLGADRFIIKPTDPAAFISIIRELIAEHPGLNTITPRPMILREDEYLSEHNRSLFHQLEKKMGELEEVNRVLQQSEEKYKSLFENASDAIILFEVSPAGEYGDIREVNQSACEMLEYSHEELSGMKMPDIFTQEYIRRFEEIFPLLYTSGNLTFEGELLTRTGRIISAEMSTHLSRTGDTCHCLSIFRDITQRKAIMDELSRAVTQINTNILQMATIGDEIRNPLAIILSVCEECQDSGCRNLVSSAVRQIDEFISRLDKGWVESEKVKGFLMKHYGITSGDST